MPSKSKTPAKQTKKASVSRQRSRSQSKATKAAPAPKKSPAPKKAVQAPQLNFDELFTATSASKPKAQPAKRANSPKPAKVAVTKKPTAKPAASPKKVVQAKAVVAAPTLDEMFAVTGAKAQPSKSPAKKKAAPAKIGRAHV